jgi:protein tyrosine phosphatase (PTP) superfamily phosphohydrolase (DUF442 family)
MISSNRPVTIQAPVRKPQPVSLERKAKQVIAHTEMALGQVGFVRRIGYWLYDHLHRPKLALDNQGQLSPTVLRGAQPTAEGFKQLKAQGVDTIINLRPEEDWERPLVGAAGEKYIYLPIPVIGAPSRQQGLAFLSAVTDPANGKVFFHCLHGADRTGAMAAIYRIAAQGWTAEQALAEMPRYRFREGYEDDKLAFVKDFATYWASLPEAKRKEVLHR